MSLSLESLVIPRLRSSHGNPFLNGYYGLHPKGTSSRCALRVPRTCGARNNSLT